MKTRGGMKAILRRFRILQDWSRIRKLGRHQDACFLTLPSSLWWTKLGDSEGVRSKRAPNTLSVVLWLRGLDAFVFVSSGLAIRDRCSAPSLCLSRLKTWAGVELSFTKSCCNNKTQSVWSE